jgi:RNA polymerase sigma-70 factor (ECF subfamily)
MSTALSKPDERTIRAACAGKDFDAATADGLRAYGAEVFGLLVALHKDRDVADDAFSLFAERFWRTLATFHWKCSLRSWVYRLARGASADVDRQLRRQERRRGPVASNASLEALKQQARTETISLLRTAKRTQLEKLRDELPPDERLLLILRVDREMPWRDIARVMSDQADEVDEDALAQEAARLRKRFQLVKERLRRQGKERGLL